MLSLLSGSFLFSQSSVKTLPALIRPTSFVNANDPFGARVFIENKGQFSDKNNSKVLYAIDNGFEKIYFTQKGLVYELRQVTKLNERQLEAIEHGRNPKSDKLYFINMNWLEANTHPTIVPEEKQRHYMTYGPRELNSSTFKKITYKNVYKNIDIEYTIPEDKDRGIKYNLLVHAGANINDVKIAYTGDVSGIRIVENEILIKTPLEDLIEHAPSSYYEDGTAVTSHFTLNKDIIGFAFPQGLSETKKLIVDPWVATTSSLSSNSYAYDVDYDFLGNTYVYGGYNPFKVACYSNSGVLQWVFAGTVSTVGWSSAPITSQASNFGVDRFTSKTYIGQGFVSSGNLIVRLDALGNYDNFINPANSAFQEVWDMGFHCTSAQVFVLGGTVSSNNSAVTMNTLTAALSLSGFQPSNSSAAQDIASHAIDDVGNIFVLYGSSVSSLNNHITLVNSTFNGSIWTQATGFTPFSEQGNKTQYQGAGTLSSNGFNALAVNANYLFYYDGSNLAAYNKTTGAVVTSTTVPSLTIKQQGGIAVDDCNNLYLGGNGSILTYSYNGSAFTQLSSISVGASSTNQYVYDIKLDKQTKILYACGSGFVGTYSPVNTLACTTASSACLFSQGGISVTTTSITCANLGSATCTAVGGTGPFTYTWLPSQQTSSVATGLSPGTHAIVVHDAGTNITYTASAYLSPLVALTGTVSNPLFLNCYGATSGTAAINNLSGGSGNQSYLWTNGITSQTTAIATGLGLGNYTVTVVDALTSCMVSQTFAVTQPPALTLTLSSNTPSACANTSITLTPLIAGGTPNYTYSWTAGPTTGIYQTTQQIPGIYVYTLTAFDSKNCPITRTISLNFINTPTLSSSNVSICPLAAGTLTVSGASSYLWNNSFTGTTFADSPTVTSIYTVVGTGSVCSSTITVSIIVKPVPNPTLTNNSPVCGGQSLQLNAYGGFSYVWTGPQGYNSNAQLSNINPATPLNSGVYTCTITASNGCTASATQSVLIRPAPVISALGSTVCITQTVSLSGTSNTGGCTFLWSGPNSFTSNLQNPVITNPQVSNSGTYQLTVTDQYTCSSVAVANVTVTAMPVASFTSNSPQCYGETLSFNASTSTGGILYNWSGPNNFTSNLQNPSINNVTLPATGIYTLNVIAGPCQSSISHSVLVNSLPGLTVVGSPAICETRTLNLSTFSSGNINSYQWHGPGSYTASSQNISIGPALLGHSGTYTITVIDNNLCLNSETVAVNILPNPVLATNNLTVCLLQPALLSASGADTYFWTGPGAFHANTGTVTLLSATYTNQVVYTVIGTSANSCTSSATMSLNTLPLPKTSLSVSPGLKLCLNDEIHFTGYGGSTYQWRCPNSFYYEKQSIDLKLTNRSYAGTYTLTAIDTNGCSFSIDTNLVIDDLPSGILSSKKKEDCVPFDSRFTFIPTNSAHIASNWLVNNSLFSGNTFTFSFKTVGTHLIKGTLYDSLTTCRNTIDYTVIGHPKPVADFTFSPEKPVENEDEVVFTNTSQGEELNSFNWFFIANGNYSSATKNTSYLFSTDGNYPVALISQNKWGCSDTVVKSVRVEIAFSIYIPNVFTPNNDNLNELFKPVMRGVKLYHFAVFDRWGALLFETNDPNIGWDGTYKGQLCKSDIYVWTISVSGTNGEQKKLKGHVTLNKGEF